MKCGFFSTATYLISKNCLILVLLSSIKKLQLKEYVLLFWKQNANICIKTSKQCIYTVLFRDVSFLFNVFFFVFY